MRKLFIVALGILSLLFVGCATPILNVQSNNERIESIFEIDPSKFRFLSYCYFKTTPVGAYERVSQKVGIVGLTEDDLLVVRGNLDTAKENEMISIPISDIEKISMPREIHITHGGLLTAIVLFQLGNLKVDVSKSTELYEMLAYENVEQYASTRSSSRYGMPIYGYDSGSNTENGTFGTYDDGRNPNPVRWERFPGSLKPENQN